MLNPKEKAKDLVNKFLNEQNNAEEISEAKQCALICVDEILLAESNYYPNEIDYWIEVKHEIINL